MDMIFSGATCDTMIDEEPLLAAKDKFNEHEHVINMSNHEESSSSSGNGSSLPVTTMPNHDAQSLSTTNRSQDHSPASRTASSGSTLGAFQRIMLSSTVWLFIELLYTTCQIVASVIVLFLSKGENPHAPLFIWVLGYAAACIVSLPVLYWRFRNRDDRSFGNSLGSYDDPLRSSVSAQSYSSQLQESDNFLSNSSVRGNRLSAALVVRMNVIMEHLKVILDCFFAVWFIVGNIWIFGGHTSPTDAPKLYKLCIVFLTFSCIGYAMPFILCTTLCCCMPCIISLFGMSESANRGATEEAINSLPTYKFKGNGDDACSCEGGILTAGEEKERALSSEDASCCICLNKYADEEELRELPCQHVFHVQCVDKWLKMNASCPLCKSVIGQRDIS